ncbi:MAG: OsmC family protein [Vicinamibacterales bacterium]
MATPDVIVQGAASGFAQSIDVGQHHLVADEPTDAGGAGTGPSPYDLLAAALGACTSMTISYFARKRQWPLEWVNVRVRHAKVHAEDCATCETKEGRIDRLERTIELRGQLTADQRQELLRIADRCPVHRTLTSEIEIQTSLL